jgi:cellulose synthase/poly-beta-1,6-N-acetylglucosamine synthase-like glycosyltransferase
MGPLQLYVRRHPVRTTILEFCQTFSWFMILFGSFLIPEIVAYYIIAFDVYWLYRSLTMAGLSIVAHFKIRAAARFDWLSDVKKLEHWEKVRHIVIIPTYKEPIATLERTLENLSKQPFACNRISVMLSFEEREGEGAKTKNTYLQRFMDQHLKIFGSHHPILWAR